MADEALIMTLDRADWRTTIEAIGPDLEAEGRACDRDNRFVAKNLDRLEAAGLFALGVPTEFGGGGAGPAELGAMLRAVGRFDGSTALALAMHTHQVAIAAWRRANTGAPTEGPLKAVGLDGKRLLSSGGSDWLPGSGEATRVDGGYRIKAVKVFSSGSPDGDLMMTCAVFDDPADGPTVLHFGVPMSAPEVTIRETWDTLGMRGTASHEVVIDGLFIADDKIGGKRPAGKWHPLFHITSMIAFPLIYSAYAGVADGMREAVIAGSRRKAGDLVALGEMETAHAGVELALRQMMHLAQSGAPGPETTGEVMALRTLIGRFCLETADKAMECAGGAGFFRAGGLEQRFRDMQACRHHPLKAKDQALYAARLALGLSLDG